MKILISDDEDSARYALKKLLIGPGRTILEASDGKQTYEAIVESNPDLVFLDLNMPIMDGRAVLIALQQRQSTHSQRSEQSPKSWAVKNIYNIKVKTPCEVLIV